MKSFAKVNRFGEKLLGISIFLSADEVQKFLEPETKKVEIEKSVMDDGIFLRFGLSNLLIENQ